VRLVDALIRAQSGYRSDVAALVKELKRSDVFAPLAKGGNIPRRRTILKADTLVTLHNIRSGDGTPWIALFSSVETLRKAGAGNGWMTDGGPLQFAGFKWDAAIEGMFRDALESGGNAGIVFDVGSPSELGLNAAEVISIARGDVVPLVNYVAQQPTRDKEVVYVGEPAIAPPAELIEVIKSVLESEPAVTAHRLRQIFTPERDVMAHLLLDIESQTPEPERRRISQRVGDAIRGIPLAPPGYLDITFNFSGAVR
jgi:hypothetical protein